MDSSDSDKYEEDCDPADLKLVVEMTRHGERQAGKLFPGMAKYSDEEFDDKKDLTHIGALNMFAGGRALRAYMDKRDLFRGEINPEDVYVQTTAKQRARMSAVARLDGLLTDMDDQAEQFQDEYYPDSDDQTINPISTDDDWLLKPNKNCGLHDKYEDQGKLSPIFPAFDHDME